MNARPALPVDKRAAIRQSYAPVPRAELRAADTIVAQMADDLRVFAANCGSVSTDDLELIGWTAAQIAAHGTAARRRAYAREVRAL
jgi:hypothetical protein